MLEHKAHNRQTLGVKFQEMRISWEMVQFADCHHALWVRFYWIIGIHKVEWHAVHPTLTTMDGCEQNTYLSYLPHVNASLPANHTHTSRGRMAKWNEDVIFRLYSIIILDKKRITKRRRFNDACWVLEEKAEIPSQQQRGAFATSFQGCCCCCCRRGYLQHAMQTYCIIVQTDRVPLKDPYLLHSVNSATLY